MAHQDLRTGDMFDSGGSIEVVAGWSMRGDGGLVTMMCSTDSVNVSSTMTVENATHLIELLRAAITAAKR